MKIFFSGQSSKDAIPEILLEDRNPDVMLTFHDFAKGKLTPRAKRYLRNHLKWKKIKNRRR